MPLARRTMGKNRQSQPSTAIIKWTAPSYVFKLAYSKRTAGEALDPEPKLANNVALKLTPFMAVRPARWETNEA
jgi:hypothetical protein